jgi:hypothetical protein
MCGWNEPERVNVQSVEVKVDAALIEQLLRRDERQTHGRAKAACSQRSSVAANSEGQRSPLAVQGHHPAG